jgi:hypothetical protein
VPLQEQLLEALERLLDRVRLVEHVHAVGVALDHAADAAQVTLDVR